jgi:Tol biopolymer transport system component
MKDHDGVVQLWTVSPRGGEPRQVTRQSWDIASTFSWSPDGRRIAHVMDRSVFVTEVETGRSTRLTPRSGAAVAPLDLACVFSPDGRHIAFQRKVSAGGNSPQAQIFVVDVPAL